MEDTALLLERMESTLRHTYIHMTLHGISSPFSGMDMVNETYRFHFSGKLCMFILAATSKIQDAPIPEHWVDDANRLLQQGFYAVPGDFETLRIGNRLYVLTGFSLPEAQQVDLFRKFHSDLHCLSGVYTCDWTMGVGEFVSTPEALQTSVRTAQHAIKFCITEGTGRLYDANTQQAVFDGGLVILSPSEELSLRHLVEKQRQPELQEKIRSLFAGRGEQISKYPAFAYMLSLQIQHTVLQTLREIMPVDRETFEMALKQEAAVENQMTLEGLICHTISGTEALCQSYDQFLSEGRSRPIWLVSQYIQAHYTENLTLEQLSRIAQRNPQYISAVFSKACGMSIKEYITGLRIDEAKRLLRMTMLPVGEVALRVGYQDAKYFSRVFRQQTAMSPMQYRCAEALSEGTKA